MMGKADRDEVIEDLFVRRDLVLGELATIILYKAIEDQRWSPCWPLEVVRHMEDEGRLPNFLVRKFLQEIGVIDHP